MGDPQIRSTQCLLAIEIENLPQKDPKIDPIGEDSLDHNTEFSMHDLMDYLGSKTERSILIEKNLITLRDKYDISDEYKMIVLGLECQVFEPSEGCIAFYDESVRSNLRFLLHPFFSNIFDFYRVHPIQITPNAIRMTIVFIIMCNFLHIDLRIFLFRSLVLLKRHLSEKDWWYFSSQKNHKFEPNLHFLIHD